MINMLLSVDHVRKVANDNSYGYSQPRRSEAKEDDCSSLSLDGLKLGGVDIKGATYTGNALQPLLEAGFVDVSSQVNKLTGEGLKMYDVLLRPATPKHGGHMAIMITDTKLVQAAGDADGKRGDSSGKEIYEREFVGSFSTPPLYVLRHPQPVPVQEPAVTPTPRETYRLFTLANTSADGTGDPVKIYGREVNIVRRMPGTKNPYGLTYTGGNVVDAWFPEGSFE